jgi:hypothetical protein
MSENKEQVTSLSVEKTLVLSQYQEFIKNEFIELTNFIDSLVGSLESKTISCNLNLTILNDTRCLDLLANIYKLESIKCKNTSWGRLLSFGRSFDAMIKQHEEEIVKIKKRKLNMD